MLPDAIAADLLPFLLSVLSGIVVGVILSLTGGGGSILAIPLLVYVVGMKDPHSAIGTSALAVGITAFVSMLKHRSHGHVRFRTGIVFAIPGIAGTVAGSHMAFLTPPNYLLILFALFMMFVGAKMFTTKPAVFTEHFHTKNLHVKKVSIVGFLVGIAAGFFGIGGGFLVVPALISSTGLNIIDAIGTSLVPVSLFGLSTASSYFFENKIDWITALAFSVGGLLGVLIGTRFSARVSKTALTKGFSIFVISVAIYMIVKTFSEISVL